MSENSGKDKQKDIRNSSIGVIGDNTKIEGGIHFHTGADPKPDKPLPESKEKTPGWVLKLSVASGLTFIVLLLVIAVFIPKPSVFQIFVFRVVLALAAAAFGATIPGFLKIDVPLWGKGLISAGGALGLFVLIYQVNPPALMTETKPKPEITEQMLSGLVLDPQNEPLPGVLVSLTDFDQQTTTNFQGKFSFSARTRAGKRVTLMAQKDGYQTFRKDIPMGTTGFSFKMEKRP